MLNGRHDIASMGCGEDMTKDDLRAKIGEMWHLSGERQSFAILNVLNLIIESLPDEKISKQESPERDDEAHTGKAGEKPSAAELLLESVGGEFSIERSINANQKIHLDSLSFCTELVVDGLTVYPNDEHRLQAEVAHLKAENVRLGMHIKDMEREEMARTDEAHRLVMDVGLQHQQARSFGGHGIDLTGLVEYYQKHKDGGR
jgi:hypothetical protein